MFFGHPSVENGHNAEVFKKYEEAIIERQNQEKGEAESEDSGIFAGSDMIEKNMDNEKN